MTTASDRGGRPRPPSVRHRFGHPARGGVTPPSAPVREEPGILTTTWPNSRSPSAILNYFEHMVFPGRPTFTAEAVTLLALITALSGCGSEKTPPAMPKVEGLTLDAAKAELKKAGLEKDPEVSGGGAIGIVREKNWTVCAQTPAAGHPAGAAPKLSVARDCAPTPVSTSAAATTTSAPVTSQAPEPSAAPSTRRLTTKDPQFEQILALGDNCSPDIEAFAAAHQGDELEFDGNVLDVQSHGDAKTRFDFLLGAGPRGGQGTKGPAFKLEDKNAFDLKGGGKVPESISAGQHARFVVKVDRYNPTQCLLYVDPVSTTFD